jgi:hypothetical protein
MRRRHRCRTSVTRSRINLHIPQRIGPELEHHDFESARFRFREVPALPLRKGSLDKDAQRDKFVVDQRFA